MDVWGLRGLALENLPLTGAEFWASTLAELTDMLRGVYERERRHWERAAWMTAHLMNASGNMKKTVQPSDLISFNRPPREKVAPGDRAAVDELLRRQRTIGRG